MLDISILSGLPDWAQPFIWALIIVGFWGFVRHRKIIIPFMIATWLFVRKIKKDFKDD